MEEKRDILKEAFEGNADTTIDSHLTDLILVALLKKLDISFSDLMKRLNELEKNVKPKFYATQA
jgi:hypothetical protein